MLTDTPVTSRASALEQALGDPHDQANPTGLAALIAADERGCFPSAAEAVLDHVRLNAEFVPECFGGRLRSLDEMARTLRPVFRRDVTLGLGYGVTSFMAAANVWTAGSSEQQRSLAKALLGGGKASVCYHELAHGNDFARNDFRADVSAGNLVLTGEKHVINNVERAAALVIFARTDQRPGSRSHSVLLVDPTTLDSGTVQRLSRYRTVGVRGSRIAGIRFDGCAVPADCVVGALGDGVEIAMRSFQMTRSALPSMAVAALDTALRVTLDFAEGRRLYGTTVSALPHARETLAAAFTDLLVCDALATVASRVVQALPGEASVLSSTAKYLVPHLIGEAVYELSVVLGARSYVREGEHAIFQKLSRDMPVLSLGHAGAAACQATILPQLPMLARRSWAAPAPAPRELFLPGAPLPPLRPEQLRLTSAGRDSLVAALEPGCAALVGVLGSDDRVDGLVDTLRQQLHRLRDEVVGLAPVDRTSFAAPRGFQLVHRYALLAAASACVNVWLAHDGRDAFLGDPCWLFAALTRLTGRLTGADGILPKDVRERMYAELSVRHRAPRSFDLDAAPLARDEDS